MTDDVDRGRPGAGEPNEPGATRSPDPGAGSASADAGKPADPQQPGDPAQQPAAGTADDGEQDAPRKTSWFARLREYALVIVIALGLSFLVKTFLVQPFWIPSGSMEDTLVVGDRIVVNKFPGSADDVRRGDIVVFSDPNHWLPPAQESGGVSGALKKGMQFVGLLPAGDQHLVKRVIGVGGDRIECCDAQGRIKVNGQPIDETYLRPGEEPSSVDFDVRVPDGKLWLMGDNRGNSEDSRAHDGESGGRVGSVPKSAVTGKVLAIVWPASRWGTPADAHQVFSKVPNP